MIEESAFPPVVRPLHVDIAVYDDEFPGGMIGRVAAHDPDLYDHLTYTVVSNEMLFDVHQWDGTLKVRVFIGFSSERTGCPKYQIMGTVETQIRSLLKPQTFCCELHRNLCG